jgi:hypothetical protein
MGGPELIRVRRTEFLAQGEMLEIHILKRIWIGITIQNKGMLLMILRGG